MQGECRADISRNAFDETNALRRVVFQGGRVILESDLNHVVSILLHRLERSIEDIVGPHGGNGFEIYISGDKQVWITKGRYYVHGVLCENPSSCLITRQPDYDFDPIGSDGSYLLYLDVFEVHRAGRPEVELQGIETVAEGKIVWQVKAVAIKKKEGAKGSLKSFDAIDPGMEQRSESDQWALVRMARENLPVNAKEDLESFESTTKRILPPLMCARTKPVEQALDPCLISPDSRYRGGRQLYRIEIHRSGYSKQSGKDPAATFKWSRENSCLIYPVIAAPKTHDGLTTVKVEHLGRDVKLGLQVGQWVELTDEQEYKHSTPGQLMQIQQIDRDQLRITLLGAWNKKSGGRLGWILRRWDHQGGEDGAIVINGEWQTLENGIEVQFEADAPQKGYYYSRGMYWTFVASAMLGDIEWKSFPNASGERGPIFSEPHGTIHHYAPLAIVEISDKKPKDPPSPLRKTIKIVAS